METARYAKGLTIHAHPDTLGVAGRQIIDPRFRHVVAECFQRISVVLHGVPRVRCDEIANLAHVVVAQLHAPFARVVRACQTQDQTQQRNPNEHIAITTTRNHSEYHARSCRRHALYVDKHARCLTGNQRKPEKVIPETKSDLLSR